MAKVKQQQQNKKKETEKSYNQIKEFLSGLKRIRDWKVNKDSIYKLTG